MNDRNNRNGPIEDRLDRLIDALNAGLTPSFTDDPELAGLADAVRSAEDVRETQWPDARFPRRMAARLSAELRLSGQYTGQSGDRRLFDATMSPPSVNGVTREPVDVDGFDLSVPRRHSRLRTTAQMAAGFAGFAILTFILVTVFRGASDNPSLGGAPGRNEPERTTFATEVDSGDVQRGVVIATPPSTPNASIAVVPYELACEGSAAVVGSGLVPGSTVDIFLDEDIPDAPDGSAVVSTTAGEDGAFQFEDLVPITTLIPDCQERAAAGGGELTFSAASVIEVDGELRYAEPAAHAPAFLMSTAESSSGATLTLDPAVGTCETTVTASGAGFEPGTQVTFSVFQIPGDNGVILEQHPNVLEDGTFAADLDLSTAIGCAGQAEVPESGIQFRVGVQTGLGPKSNGDNWRDPSASAIFTRVPSVETASPEDLELIMVDGATAAAREFLNEPEAAFEVQEVNQGEAPYVRISRQVGDAYDEFRYDVGRGEITSATIQSHTSAHVAVQPVDAEQALEIAEAIASQHHQGFDQLTLYETFDQGTTPGGDGQDQVFSATWQVKVNDRVWVPTTLQVDIDMQTGLALGYWFNHVPYRGPLDPQVAQEDAVATVEQAIATEPTVAGATIGTVELATSYSAAAEEWILVWRAHLENAPAEAPSKYIEVDALTRELLTDFGEPGGQG